MENVLRIAATEHTMVVAGPENRQLGGGLGVCAHQGDERWNDRYVTPHPPTGHAGEPNRRCVQIIQTVLAPTRPLMELIKLLAEDTAIERRGVLNLRQIKSVVGL